jgi:TolB protein
MKVIAILFVFSAAGLAQIGIFGNSGDIGETPKAGSAAFDAAKGEYRIAGGGANVWGAADAFQFAWKRATGDITLTADVHFVGAGAVPHRKAMLMIRQSLEAGAAYADIALHGSGLTSLQYRPDAGKITVGVPSKIEAPVRIRIERRGDRIAAYAGSPGQELTPVGSATVGFQGPVYAGLGVCSHDANLLETALFTNVTLEAAPAPAVKSSVTVYDIASGDRKVIFTGNGFYQAPNWSPDGKYLMLNTPGKLWRLPLATGAMEPIATGEVKGINNDHGISRDGKLLTISAGNIYTLPATGGEPKQITNRKPSYFHGFSPDGKWMAFCAQRDNNFDIYRIPTEGGTEERLTSHPGYDDGSEYSPDGKWIYFNSNRTGSWDIWRMPANGAGPGDAKAEQVTSDEMEDWFPHLSPDGKWLVLISFEKGIPNHPANKNVILRIMPAPGAHPGKPELREIVKLFGGQGTINVNSWSPDSSKFAYVSYELLK